MKRIALLAVVVFAPLAIAGYSVIFNIEILGNSYAIAGYKLMWVLVGAIFAFIYKWISSNEN